MYNLHGTHTSCLISLFFSFILFFFICKTRFLHHVPRVARTYITMPHVRSHPHPLQSTSSFTTDQCAIVDPNPLRVSQSRTGASYNAALPNDIITVRMRITCTFGDSISTVSKCTSAFRDIRNFSVSKLF